MMDLGDSQQRLIAGAALLLATVAFVRLLLGSRARGKRLPPTIPGAPVVGGLIKFMRGPIPMIREEYARLGSVFTVPILSRRITFLIGPEVSAHFFKGNEAEMSQQEVYRFNVPTFGPGVVFDVDYSVRQEQFRFFTEALRASKLRSYVDQMVAEAEEYFSKWGESGTVNLKYELEHLIILTASRCLLGREVREKLFDDVSALFHDLDNGMQPVSVIFPYLPIPAHKRRDRARARLAAIFATRLSHIYKNPDSYDPDRFGPGREEDKAAGAFSYISFGGGRHGCLGEPFAYLQIKAIWTHLLRNFEFELVSPFPENDWNAMVVGIKGEVMVNYKRRKLVVDN
ncbi:hypothetical protein PVAP13_8NG104200 [Panicum virgatum]|uniref:Obtusifoliol 14-alpha demethylase n=1 Tax=Panicum virgatum TaxID=38727 RepID=A0A8T0P706_PANVG|nr:hypothetical protein PVAP13_8NG104200 [Panicum virgatum]